VFVVRRSIASPILDDRNNSDQEGPDVVVDEDDTGVDMQEDFYMSIIYAETFR